MLIEGAKGYEFSLGRETSDPHDTILVGEAHVDLDRQLKTTFLIDTQGPHVFMREEPILVEGGVITFGEPSDRYPDVDDLDGLKTFVTHANEALPLFVDNKDVPRIREHLYRQVENIRDYARRVRVVEVSA